MLRAVCFDMDGVLIDSEPLHTQAFTLCAQSLGFSLNQIEIDQYVGTAPIEQWRILKKKFSLSPSPEELTARQIAEYRALLTALPAPPRISGVSEFLRELKARSLPLALVSSNARPSIALTLDVLGFEDMFDVIVSGDDVEHAKPAPDVYLAAAKKLDVPPEHCLAIEDARNGVLAAKRAGMRCLGFINPHSGGQDLSDADGTTTNFSSLSLETLTNLFISK